MKSRLLAAGLVLLCASPAQAQERELRFQRTFTEVGAKGTGVLLDRDTEDASWDVRLVNARTGKTLSQATFPEWAGAAYYTYRTSTIAIGPAFVILLEAVPNADAPNVAASFQVAFARGAKDTAWKQIASVRHSVLDGGDRLLVRVRDNQAELVRVSSAPSTFCGGKAAAFVFDPDLLAFRTDFDIDTAATSAAKARIVELETPFTDDGLPGFHLWYLATSDRLNADDSRTVIRPIELGDNKTTTAWVEGRPGLGRGQFVTARINPSLKLRGFRIFPGHGASEAEFRAFAVPTQLLVSTEEQTFTVDVPAQSFDDLRRNHGLFVQLPESQRTRCMTVAILDSQPGNATGDDAWKAKATAISEITPVSELHELPPDFAAVVVVEKLLKETDPKDTRRLATLTTPLGPHLAVILEKVVTQGTDEDRERVAPLLRNLPSEQAVPILIDLFERAQPESTFYIPVKRGLEMHRDVAGPRLARTLRDHPPANAQKHVDLLRLVGRLATPDELRFLTANLGEGDDLIRKERIRALIRAGKDVLPDLFAVMKARANSPAAYDALRAVASIGRKVFAHEPGTVEGAHILTEVVRDAHDPRTRMLAIRALGHFSCQDALPTLSRVLDRDRNPLVRRTAVQALVLNPEREARLKIESALNDDSPDVRIAAAEAIGNREDRNTSVPALRDYTAKESWPSGLAAGYAVLVQLQDPTVHTFLERELLRDPYTQRAEIITDALKRGSRSLAPNVSRQLLNDPKTSFVIKRHVIDTLGLTPAPDNENILVPIASQDLPFPQFDETRNANLRVRAMLAIGRLRSETGRDFLLERLQQTNDLNWQRAVLRALSFSNDPHVADRLEQFLDSAPQTLREDVKDTLTTVRRRSAVDDVVDSIED